MDSGFKRHQEINRANRRHRKRGRYTVVANELNQEPTNAEVFKQTYTRKENKEMACILQSLTLTHRLHNRVLKREMAQITPPLWIPMIFWHDVVGEPYNNRRYGLGYYFSRTQRFDPQLRFSRGTSEHALSQHTIEELHTKTQDLTQELNQRGQRNEEAEKRV
ncbi:hypothetical protein PIB30_070296 [Stylosanthes scabra]|uniref:Uncharacterized protein n=1 Tax=Stylosanthes scabra TaxID=79078 RepID=A0ABU6RP92_9FABA|nr:hypothetical protein [Stylosanthes scabra]